MSIFLNFEGQDGLGGHRTPGWIELSSHNGGQDGPSRMTQVPLGGPSHPLRPLHPYALGLSRFTRHPGDTFVTSGDVAVTYCDTLVTFS